MHVFNEVEIVNVYKNYLKVSNEGLFLFLKMLPVLFCLFGRLFSHIVKATKMRAS